MATITSTTTSSSTYGQALNVLKSQRILWFGVCFGIDLYDTYLHKYPSPDPTEVQRRERGAWAKCMHAYYISFSNSN